MSLEPKTLHIWMPDGRSLCDRRARPDTDVYELSDEEFESFVAEQESAPACGSCLLLAGRIRHLAIAMLFESKRRIYPASPTEAWSLLEGTRWVHSLDLDAFLEASDLDDKIVYEAIELAADPAVGRGLAENRAVDWGEVRRKRAKPRDASE